MMPKGFMASALNCGIKENVKKPDVAIFISKCQASAAGVFTKNRIKSAPVIISKKRLPGKVRAVIANSGNANAITGKEGIRRALLISKKASELLNIKEKEILLASTGVIGIQMPYNKIIDNLPILIKNADNKLKNFKEASIAIMTTDTFPKIYNDVIHFKKGRCSILGIAKGAGMICPSMATMLSFIFTDAGIEPLCLKKFLSLTVEKTFNRITVDGDMSTNDTVYILANGMSYYELKTKEDKIKFLDALYNISISLAKDIVRDGEGATKIVEIIVRGAKTSSDGKKIAYSIANSLLVKTAIYGADVNWGRILAAAGASSGYINEEKVSLNIGGICLIKNGKILRYDEKAVKEVMKKKEFRILLNINAGKYCERVITSDITERYIEINSSYRS